jgi:hypothetical protein
VQSAWQACTGINAPNIFTNTYPTSGSPSRVPRRSPEALTAQTPEERNSTRPHCEAIPNGRTQPHIREPDPTNDAHINPAIGTNPEQNPATQPPAPNTEIENEQLNMNLNLDTEGDEPMEWDNISSSNGIQPDEPPRPTPPIRQNGNKKKIHAGLKISSLNIKGYGHTGQGSKWMHINQLIREQCIGILALQESHHIGKLHCTK